MSSPKPFLQYKFVFACGSLVTLLPGLVVLAFLILGAGEQATGEWNSRNRAFPTQALAGMIQSLRQQGYTLVIVSELLNIEPYK